MTSVTSPQTISAAGRSPVRMSFEEWLAWEHDGIAEWVNGEVIFVSTTELHQTIVEFLDRVLGLFVQMFKLGKVHTVPYAMRAKPDGNAREPDVVFISSANLHRVTDALLNGPADLVVEVVSEENVSRDRDDKFFEYEEAGVREYWIIDPRPNRKRAYFYVLDEDGRYQPMPVGRDGVYRSQVVPGFWLNVNWLWEDAPDGLSALAHIVGVEKLMDAVQMQKKEP